MENWGYRSFISTISAAKTMGSHVSHSGGAYAVSALASSRTVICFCIANEMAFMRWVTSSPPIICVPIMRWDSFSTISFTLIGLAVG
jgi:hypothetical protein